MVLEDRAMPSRVNISRDNLFSRCPGPGTITPNVCFNLQSLILRVIQKKSAQWSRLLLFHYHL